MGRSERLHDSWLLPVVYAGLIFQYLVVTQLLATIIESEQEPKSRYQTHQSPPTVHHLICPRSSAQNWVS